MKQKIRQKDNIFLWNTLAKFPLLYSLRTASSVEKSCRHRRQGYQLVQAFWVTIWLYSLTLLKILVNFDHKFQCLGIDPKQQRITDRCYV